MMNRVGVESDIGLNGITHEVQRRSDDNKTCLLWCGVVW